MSGPAVISCPLNDARSEEIACCCSCKIHSAHLRHQTCSSPHIVLLKLPDLGYTDIQIPPKNFLAQGRLYLHYKHIGIKFKEAMFQHDMPEASRYGRTCGRAARASSRRFTPSPPLSCAASRAALLSICTVGCCCCSKLGNCSGTDAGASGGSGGAWCGCGCVAASLGFLRTG